MPLKKLGEKLKTSLHHLSPKCKKADEAHGGDLSPCSLPPAPTTPAKPVEPTEPKTCATASNISPQKQAKEEPVRAETPAPTVTTAEPDCIPAHCPPPSECTCPAQPTTPRWQENANIYPTMYYALKTRSKDPVQQSVLLVNPSKFEKTYSLRLRGDSNADLEKESVRIPGDYVERVTVTVKPEKETTDVYVDLLEGGHLYDKLRVQVQQN